MILVLITTVVWSLLFNNNNSYKIALLDCEAKIDLKANRIYIVHDCMSWPAYRHAMC